MWQWSGFHSAFFEEVVCGDHRNHLSSQTAVFIVARMTDDTPYSENSCSEKELVVDWFKIFLQPMKTSLTLSHQLILK